MAGKRRHFGRVRKLASGRFQVRYVGADGILRPAPKTFPDKKSAELWLSEKQVELARGDWINPDAGRVSVAEYVGAWVADHPKLRIRTRENYGSYLRNQIVPYIGGVDLRDLTSPRVRKWLRSLEQNGVGDHRRAGAYRLLRAALNTGVTDHVIARNPCNIRGAGTVHTPEREPVELAKVFELADAVPRRWRALILLAAFATVRWGELVGLRRMHVDLDACTVRIAKSGVQADSGDIEDGDPKSRAGFRTVNFPDLIVPDLRAHLEDFVGPRPDNLVFTGARGGRPRRNNFHRIWRKARQRVGLPDIHLHDLRHTSSTYAAEAGATLRELMQRMGHSTPRAAMIYLHAREGRDRQIADRMGTLAAEARKAASPSKVTPPNGSEERPADMLPEAPRGTRGARTEASDDASTT